MKEGVKDGDHLDRRDGPTTRANAASPPRCAGRDYCKAGSRRAARRVFNPLWIRPLQWNAGALARCTTRSRRRHKMGITGGRNIGREYLTSGLIFPSWRDMDVAIEGAGPARFATAVAANTPQRRRFVRGQRDARQLGQADLELTGA